MYTVDIHYRYTARIARSVPMTGEVETIGHQKDETTARYVIDETYDAYLAEAHLRNAYKTDEAFQIITIHEPVTVKAQLRTIYR